MFLSIQRAIFALVGLIFMMGIGKLLMGHGRFTSLEKISAFLLFGAGLAMALVWILEREETVHGILKGTISSKKKNFLGMCTIVMGMSGFLWWLAHPGAPDQWVWLLGALFFSGGGLVLVFKKPRVSDLK